MAEMGLALNVSKGIRLETIGAKKAETGTGSRVART
jgi:hypothetical protein